jgi:hypothetical protein
MVGFKHWEVSGSVRLLTPVPCSGFQGGPREPNPNVLREVLNALNRQQRVGGRA